MDPEFSQAEEDKLLNDEVKLLEIVTIINTQENLFTSNDKSALGKL